MHARFGCLVFVFAACTGAPVSTAVSPLHSDTLVFRVTGLEGDQLWVRVNGDEQVASRIDDELALVLPARPADLAAISVRDRTGNVIADGVVEVELGAGGELEVQHAALGAVEVAISNFEVVLARTPSGANETRLTAEFRAPGSGDALDVPDLTWTLLDPEVAHLIPEPMTPEQALLVHLLPRPAPMAICAGPPYTCWKATVAHPNHAGALRRFSLIRTTIDAGFATSDHTVTVRFLAQFPRALEGALFWNSATGPGEYSISIGGVGPPGADPTNGQPSRNVWFQLRWGGVQHSYLAPLWFERSDYGDWTSYARTRAPDPLVMRWHHLAVVRSGSVLRVYLDGEELLPTHGTRPPAPVQVAASGELVIGSRATSGWENQFYGLVDDLAVFTGGKSVSEIGWLALAPRLTGSEPDLLAAVWFDGVAAPAIRTPVFTNSWAVLASNDRDPAKDRARLPRPAQAMTHQLPFLPGEVWMVIQPPAVEGSHRYAAAFSWDFQRIPASQVSAAALGAPTGPVIGALASIGARFLATSDGTFHSYYRSPSAPPTPGNDAMLARSTASATEYSYHEHVDAVSWRISSGALEPRTVVGQVERAAAHLHYSSSTGPGGHTTPMEFSSYEVSRDYGRTWSYVAAGAPQLGEWVRRPATPGLVPVDARCGGATPAGAQVLRCDDPTLPPGSDGTLRRSQVSRASGRLDVAARNAGIMTTWTWDGVRWSSTGRAELIASAPALAATSPSRLQALVRGTDDRLYGSMFDGTAWTPYTMLGGETFVGDPAAVSSGPGVADVIVLGTDGRLWAKSFNGTSWAASYTPVDWSSTTFVGTPAVISRAPNHLEVFVRSSTGQLHHGTRDHGGWSQLVSLGASQIASDPVVVSRSPDRLDVFVRGTDGALYTKSWDGASWSGYVRLGAEQFLGDPAAVASAPDRIDVFVRGNDDRLYAKSCSATTCSNPSAWTGYVQRGSNPIASSPIAASLGSGQIDVVVVGTDRGLYVKRCNPTGCGEYAPLGGHVH